MYVGVKELEAENAFEQEWLRKIRKVLSKTKWAVGVHRKESRKIAIVLLDMPKIKWYMAGSPLTVFMQNSVMKEHSPRLINALKSFPLQKGTYHIQDLGIDHSQLDSFKGKYDWGKHEGKIKKFQQKMDRGDFIDETGSPCDTCVDEQQFYGCPDCDYNPLADEMNEEYDELDDEFYP